MIFCKIIFIFTEYIGGTCNTVLEKEDYRVKLTKNIDYELSNEAFVSRTKDGGKGVFSRDRVLTLRKLLVIIMTLNRAVQRGLDSFFQKLDSSDYTIREATKGAFSQARSKLNEWGFIRLNEIAVETFYDNVDYNKWHNFRLLGVDGTRLLLPNHPSIKEEFEECSFGPNADSKRSLAIGSMLYDVLNHITIDAQLAPFKSTKSKKNSEMALLKEHMPKMKQGDLLLLDRGYPSIGLFFLLIAQNIEFCVRMKGSWWNEVRAFRASSEKEKIVTFTLPKKDKDNIVKKTNTENQTIKCRLIKVELDTGELEILCTSLTDTITYPEQEFKAL